MGLNLLVAAAKGAFGLATGALAVAADSVHSLVDGAANVIGLFVVGWSAQPPDDEHPYGHEKLEVLAAVTIGLAIALTALRFGWSAIDALVSGHDAPATSVLGFVVIGGTWIINMGVATYEARKAKELSSTYLAADAAHTASDVLVTAGVMAAYTATHFGISWADPVGALLVLVIIGRVAWRLIVDNLAVLVDAAVIDPKKVFELTMSVSGVRGCHRIRSRGIHSAVLIDLHVLLDNELTLREAHAIAHAVEEKLRIDLDGIADVTVHMEPEEDGHETL